MRWYRFWPLLKRAQNQIGTPIITNENGRLFSLNIDLVVDYQALFAFHNGAGFSVNLGSSAPSTGDLKNSDGTFTLDTGGQFINQGSSVTNENSTVLSTMQKGLF